MAVNSSNNDEMKELLKEFEENPFDTDKIKPADIMRIFFQFSLPIIPVVSRRDILIGIITKDAITSEMSDIERFNDVKIDKFVTKIARKMTFDEVLPYISQIKEFTVINIFGEVQGAWSRLQLLAACENQVLTSHEVTGEIESQKDEQQIQWMVYHILEHIPRPLYAINQNGKTVFYNSHFEEMYFSKMKSDEVDVAFIEKTLANSAKNDFFYRKNSKEIYFHNKDVGFYYEKIEMYNFAGVLTGYLIYCGRDINDIDSEHGISLEGGSLLEMLQNAERDIIVRHLNENNNLLEAVASKLQMPKATLNSKMKKYNIIIPE